MDNPRPRGRNDSSTDSDDIDSRFRSIANRVLNSPPSTAEKKRPRPVKGRAKSHQDLVKEQSRSASGKYRAARGSAQ